MPFYRVYQVQEAVDYFDCEAASPEAASLLARNSQSDVGWHNVEYSLQHEWVEEVDSEGERVFDSDKE